MISEGVLLALLKPSDTRNNDDIDKIAEFCRNFSVFKEIQECLYRSFCRIIEIEEFEPGEVIYNEGDVGSDWYVIVTGQVKLVSSINSTEPRQGVLKIGDEFGRNARDQDVRRSETITAKDAVQALKINRRQWQEIHANLSNGIDADGQGFATEFLQALQPMAGMNLATSIAYKVFESNSVIERQGKQTEGVYFIIKGTASVVREVEFNTKTGKVTRLIEIDELFPGAIFGIRPLCLNHANSVSIIAKSEVSAYVLARSDFYRKIELNKQRKVLPPDYPDDDTIRKLYQKQMKWERYKSKVVKEVLQHKKAKKELGLQS